MISSLTGLLHQIDEDRVHLKIGPMVYEAMVPASDIPLLRSAAGEEMTFHTILYFEGDSSGGNLEPRLIGFLRKEDKRFFETFITVKGIGPKKALKALIFPAGEIAQAIEARDTKFLKQLPAVGNRMAEQIVAELAGKVKEFAGAMTKAQLNAAESRRQRVPAEEDAIQALIALGERRGDAETLLERVRSASPELRTANDLVREMLRARTLRA